jgi:hypothetical protein
MIFRHDDKGKGGRDEISRRLSADIMGGDFQAYGEKSWTSWQR